MCIGLKIKELASKENITLAELAKRLGKTKQAIYEMVEKDDVNTSILRRLCHEFGIPVTFFFEDDPTSFNVTADHNSQAVGIGNITKSEDSEKVAMLEQKVRLLEELITEKERLIKVLMKNDAESNKA